MQYSFSRIHFHLISISALQNMTSKAPCSSLSARMTQLQSQALSCESGKTKPKIDLLGNFGRIGQITSESFWYYTLDVDV